ncbi:site-specific integrase [Bradyrhizobium sp. MOS002]|uniref:tyrosine-type recombinase/integrase n=1 Tax=Bradyrhizobium sp. MOS002 TaxID=2133947 RepID=UPI001FE08860|nr:site-specific integrase [Bradyrhizobium sp. MOS002]
MKYDVGTDAAGKRKTRYASFKGSKREAAIELAKLIAAAAAGEQVDPTRMTVSEFLDRWLRDWVPGNVSPKTAERYGELLRLHVRPHLGVGRVQKLRAVHLTQLYGKLGASLAPRTVGHVHRVLRQSLGHAMDWDILATNPAARVKAPHVDQEEVETLTAAEIRAVLEKARGRPIYQIAALALATGMRRGELLALRWQDISLDRSQITVARSLEQTAQGLRFKPPKTRHGRRTITLPASAVADLRSHWKAQQELRLALGAGKSPPSSLVFADSNGEPRKPNAVTKEWQRTAGMAKVTATFHSLRHTHASQLIAGGIDILTVSRRLGHASAAITMNVYAHLIPQTDERAAAAIETAILATGFATGQAITERD